MDRAVSTGHNADGRGVIEFFGQRQLQGIARRLVQIAAIVLPTITIAIAFTGWFDPMTRRAGHLLFAIPLVFLLYPRRRGQNDQLSLLDLLLAGGAVAAFGWIVIERERILWRFVYVDPVTSWDVILGSLAILLVLEATRRTLGWTIVVVTVLFLAYAFAGPYLPWILGHKGVPASLLIEHLYLVPEGLFNQITGIMATYLLVFLTFGTFLRRAGGDQVFLELAARFSRRSVGGPAKAAIVASTLMGSVSGSTIANVVTAGTVTIPLMKRVGFRAHEAASIETAAGTGGALMPPVMGAGVFIMAELTGVPLVTILLYSLLPALVYFGSLYAYVHIKARKDGIGAFVNEEGGSLRATLAKAWPLLIPLGVLLFLLFRNYSPFYASALSVVVLLAISYLREDTRLTPHRLLHALEASTRGALALSATAASAAIMMGVISITGLMLKVTSVMVALAGGSLFVGILLVALVSTIIGLGLPVTSTYIIVATLGAAALAELGTSMLAAHLIVYWFAQTATITPPVCMTAFVAATIAGAGPMRTGFEAMWVGKALYLVPFMFAYASLLAPSWWEVVFDAGASLLSLTLLTAAAEGYFNGRLDGPRRLVLGAASICCVIAALEATPLTMWLWLSAGLALLVGVSLAQRRRLAAVVPAESREVSA
jgi:TRAP transporter 4TM/12TM fusion protein